MALNVLGISEQKFFERFDAWERAQMLATYEARREIEWVQATYPLPPPKGK